MDGLWQNNKEIDLNLSLDKAMSSAIRSYHDDIKMILELFILTQV